MRVAAVELVFGEILGFNEFAYIVEHAAHTGEEGVASDGVACVFGEIGDHEAVVPGSGASCCMRRRIGWL